MEEISRFYLNQYLGSLPAETVKKKGACSAGYFCADEYNANLCAELILRGEKRASCGMEYWYRHTGEAMPQVGDLQVVTDWNGKPVCIIELTSVSKCKYSEVTEEFAYEEGEGDKSLEWWHTAHWKFFSFECNELGINPTEDIMLVLERFKVVYK